tara:strand:+ start:2458 stop:3378 length:921 start_codon:yes stop_codon:yes gene_type:complete
MIEVQSLTRRYGKTTAVDGVSFSIGDSQVIGLLGHNGAGKSTIMRMLSGYLEPSSGSITIGGLDIERHSREIQQQLGYLPENLPVYPDMMLADYLDYAATLKGIERGARARAVRSALLATDLTGRAMDKINTLSRGFRQRAGVAQALLGDPQLLILDEPTNGLDPGQTEHMRELVRRLATRSTVILSTHIMQEVDAVCDRVLMLRNGRLALDKKINELHQCTQLQLRARGDNEALCDILRRIPQVESLQQQPDGHFVVALRQGVDPDTAAANISQCVIGSGAKLLQVSPVIGDLQSVFREVNRHVD